MPRPYPDPNMNQTIDVFKYANTVTNGIFVKLAAAITPIVIFAVLLSKGYKATESAFAALFLSTILNAILWASGLLAGEVMVVFVVLLIAAALVNYLNQY